MKFFHVICTLENRKINLIIQSNSLEEAKKLIHNQGYTIIQITEETNSRWGIGGYYYFESIGADGVHHEGKIQATDITSAYRELVDHMGFLVNFIYDDPNTSYEEKIKTIAKVRANYEVFHTTKQDDGHKEKIIEGDQLRSWTPEISLFLKEEIRRYGGIIDSILARIEALLVTYRSSLSADRIVKIEDLIPALRQVKNSSNINKLRLVWQKALLKIGEIEKELVTQQVINEKQLAFQDTNKLLKNLWSKERIVLDQDDMRRRLSIVIEAILSFFHNLFLPSQNEHVIAKNSSTHLQILRELSLYRKKQREIVKEIFFAYLTFSKEKQPRLRIKYSLIKQNIALISHRLKGGSFSFTMITQGFDYYKEIIVYLVQKASYFFLWILLIITTSSVFVILFTTQNHPFINPSILPGITLLSVFTLSSRLTRSFVDLVWLGSIMGLGCVFLSLNF